MKKLFLAISVLFTILMVGNTQVYAVEHKHVIDAAELKHNWVEYSTDYNEVDGGTHEYTYWKNFIKRTRTCHKTHVIKTVVYYCEKHDHTKSETFLDETIHSHPHGE